MNNIEIIIPVKNEEENIVPLVTRISAALITAKIKFSIVFIDDKSSDKTVKKIKSLQKKFPVSVYKKIGKPGKAFSIIEGLQHTTSEHIAMIDADLQYPPEVIPAMFELTQHAGVVVARRSVKKQSALRVFISKSFQYVFGKVLYGFDCDVQSGLKIFKRDILLHLNTEDISPWTLDIPLLYTALQLGYTIDEVQIEFVERTAGSSKIKFFSSIREIGGQAVRFRLKDKPPVLIPPHEDTKMAGAGVFHNGTKFITHTTLEQKESALKTFTSRQISIAVFGLLLTLVTLLFFTYQTTLVLVAIMTLIYFSDVVFNLYLILRSLHFPPEIKISQKKLDAVNDSELPIYSVLCPLYKEAHILPLFLDSISKLDWPKEKLDVLLLLEEDDTETIAAAHKMNLPKYMRVVVVPDSQPKTKPKACNYGLHFAQGEYLVIYDAEDMPDPEQLKKVYIAYQELPESVKCIQAKLNYYNPSQNLLTRFFTAEYSLWFDVILTGLQSIKTVIPLGGTSNHFRTEELIKLQGWDPFNVTEDCDLGIRLFKAGAQTAIIDSVTLEEANSSWHNWLRQRSRWIKGYMQSYLVHIRHPKQFILEQGIHALFFHLTVGGKILFLLINPLMWLLTISYFTLYAYVGPTIESLYPAPIFYMAVISLVFGNFMFMYYYMIGIAKRGHWTTMKFVFLVPTYWLLASIAAIIALYQLIVSPHYWEKTIHGLHLKKDEIEEKLEDSGKAVAVATAKVVQDMTETEYTQIEENRFARLLKKHKAYIGGLLLIIASVGANGLNFVFNAYMGRALSLTDFGNLGLLNSLFYLAMIPFGALTATLTYQAGFLDKRDGKEKSVQFWQETRKRSWKYALLASIFWIVSLPLLMPFFNVTDIVPFLAFTPVLFFGIPLSIDKGLFSGILYFGVFGLLIFLESLVKLVFGFGIVTIDQTSLIYSVIPASIVFPFFVSWVWMRISQKKHISSLAKKHEKNFTFPKRFFGMSMILGLSQMSFLSLDVLLVKHFLLPEVAGQYNLIALVGKMIFFGGTIASQFVIPFVSRSEGEKKDTSKTLKFTLLASFVFSAVGVVALGIFGTFTAPLLFGDRIVPLTTFLSTFCFGMMCFVLSRVFVTYYLAKKVYLFAFVSFILAAVQIIGLSIFHASLSEIVNVMMVIGILNFIAMVFLHKHLSVVVAIQNNADAFVSLLFRNGLSLKKPPAKEKLRILFFNWRDTKHTWYGGAEVYVHEIAKNLVADGHSVTLFCGNDGKHPRNEKIDGVQVVRRGGFYTVYIWAFLYYVLRFRGLFDVVVDCENGVPFFTPLFVEKPKVLLIHHIHQEVFRAHLKFPFSVIASVIEAKIMPFVYRNQTVMTVSESSQKEIEKIGLGNKKKITVVHCGVVKPDGKFLKNNPETNNPSFLYLGRLKPYKNVDVAINAFKSVLSKHSKAHLTIAGDGESKKALEALVTKLQIEDSVTFLGKVSEQKKHELLAQSWVMIQPSDMEGWGITVIEANTHNTPVIASNAPGLRDSVVDGKSGILVKPRNTSELAKQMEHLISNTSKRKKMASEAKVWSENFSWDKSSEAFLNCIRNQVFDLATVREIRK